MKDKKANNTRRRVVWMIIGVLCIGLSVAFCRLAGFGTDPFSCMNLGISAVAGLGFGTCELLVNLVLLLPMLFCFRKTLGIGTIFNMAGVGYTADFCIFLLRSFHVSTQSLQSFWGVRVVLMILAVVVLCFGVALYMESDLGIAPYDALGQEIEMWTKKRLKFTYARIMTDVICVGIGFALGSVVGISTLITAFFTGPLVTFFRTHVAVKIMEDNHKTAIRH
jgi:uncharacterized membrane protein YczE